MTQLLIKDADILAQGPFTMDAESIRNSEQVFPKHVIPGWEMIDVAVPAGFVPYLYYWDGREVHLKEVPEAEAKVPNEITMRQARQQLLQMGLLEEVDEFIDNLPSPYKESAQIEWEYSATVLRNRPLFNQVADYLGKSEEEKDQFFVSAYLL